MGEVTDGAPCRGAAHSGRAPGVLGLWFGGPVEAGFVSAGESVLAARRETHLGTCGSVSTWGGVAAGRWFGSPGVCGCYRWF